MYAFVQKYIAAEPVKATHFYPPTKSYLSIPISDLGQFWIEYCRQVERDENPNLFEYIKQRETNHLGFDFLFRFNAQQVPANRETTDQLISSVETTIINMIGTIQILIEKWFQSTESHSEIMACHLTPEDDKKLTWTNGFNGTIEYRSRVIFPYATAEKRWLKKFYQIVVGVLQSEQTVHGTLTFLPINGLDTIIRLISDEVLELYGSSISTDVHPLTSYKIYGNLNGDINKVLDLDSAFVSGCHNHVKNSILKIETIAQYEESHGLDFWMPLFTSIDFHTEPTEPTDFMKSMDREFEAPQITLTAVRENHLMTDLEKARHLFTYISSKRADISWSWIDIGQAIYSINSDVEGLKLWKWFTSTGTKKDDEDCENYWYTFDDASGIDLRTLEYFAFKDSPDHYVTYRNQEIKQAIQSAMESQTHTQIAKAFQVCYPHEFICSDFEKQIWYHYNGHRYIQGNGKFALMNHIVNKFIPKIEEARTEYSERAGKTKDKEIKARNEHLCNLAAQLKKWLEDVTHKTKLCEEMRICYNNNRFNDLRDSNKYLMGCPNGVMDFRDGKGVFREGKPQDYITRSTSFPFPKDYNWEHPKVKELMKYISQVHRNKAVRTYFLRLLASLLVSGNNDKIFPIFSGGKDNSKSMMVRLVESAFGSYAAKLPTSFITGKRIDPDKPNPALIHSKGTKVAFLQEPNEHESIQSGTVKELTGNDTMYARDLFQTGSSIVEIDVTFVPILITNKIPKIEDCQEAIWRRTRNLEFLSTWSENAPESEEEQMRLGLFKEDRFFSSKLKSIAPALIWVLFHTYEEYCKEGLSSPPEVMVATENFRIMNNQFIAFLADSVKSVLNLQGVPDANATVTLNELYEAYKNWFKGEGLRGKPVTRSDLRSNLEIIWKQKMADGKWSGIALIQHAPSGGLGNLGNLGNPGAAGMSGNAGGSLLKF